jgi:hypothetical protein
MNYDAEAGRGAASVGDAMTIELLTRFPYDVRKNMGTDLPLDFSEGLKELPNVRPALVTPMWMNNLINNHITDPQLTKSIKSIWDNAAERFIHLDFVRANDQRLAFDVVDGLEGALLFSKGFSFKALERLAGWAHEKFWKTDKISFAEHALKEQALKERLAQYIIYGHTHFHEIVPLDSYLHNGKLYNQVYINSGTWHSYHHMALQDPTKLKFVGMHVMTYLAFFKEDERGGRRFEAWSGSLSSTTSA